MKTRVILALLLFASVGQARERHYEKGVLLEMESAQCGYAEKSGKGFAGAILGTDSENKKTKEMLCPEYVLRSERIIYRIRPKDEKHPALLPVGEEVQFRIDKDKMKLRVPEGDNKERDYAVISMTPRADVKNAKLSDSCGSIQKPR